MNSSSLRPLVAGIVALCVVGLGVKLYTRSHTEHIGDFPLPVLQDWRRYIDDKAVNPEVTYSRSPSHCTSTVTLLWDTSRNVGTIKTIQDLQNEVARTLPRSQTTSSGVRIEQEPPHPVELNGLLAVQTESLMENNRGYSIGRAIWFVNRDKFYLLNSVLTTSFPKDSPTVTQAQTALNQATAEVTKTLTP